MPEAPGSGESSHDLPAMDDLLDDRVIAKLMEMIECTDEREYSCEETFALLDEYVDLAARNEDAAALMPLVKHHIDLCVDCKDEFQLLLQVLETDTSAPAE